MRPGRWYLAWFIALGSKQGVSASTGSTDRAERSWSELWIEGVGVIIRTNNDTFSLKKGPRFTAIVSEKLHSREAHRILAHTGSVS